MVGIDPYLGYCSVTISLTYSGEQLRLAAILALKGPSFHLITIQQKMQNKQTTTKMEKECQPKS